MYNLLLYGGFLSIVTCRVLHNDKYLSLDKYKDSDVIYFDPIKVHVFYGNQSEVHGVKDIIPVIGNNNLTTYDGDSMNRIVDEITTTSTSLNTTEEDSDEEDSDDNFDLIDPNENFHRAIYVGGLRFTTITCEVNGDQGVCTPSGYYCRNINGIVISVSGNNGGCGILPCCQVLLSCGASSNKKISYFVNPVDKIHASCGYTIKVMNENVCQIRLDFLQFDIARPRQQSDTINTPISCRDDALVINPSNGFRIPIICGYNSGQHLYIPVNASNGEKNVFLSMFLAVKRTTTFPKPIWKIRVTQYECPNNPLAVNQSPRPYRDFLHLAPPGCLQYFTNRVGTVCNFGFQSGLDYSYNYYSANTKYAICFKRSPSTCGIKFTTSFFMLSSNNDCTMGDYLFIPGAVLRYDDKLMRTNSRLCGNELPINAEILSSLEGPLYIQFESDNVGNDNEHGFCLDYEAPPAGGCN